jgi:hypothetical protein
MRARYIRQVLPWTITNGSSFVLPARGAERWRLAGVCISSAIPPVTSATIAVELTDGAGGLASRFEGYLDQGSSQTSLTFATQAPRDVTGQISTGATAFLPPDLWVHAWERLTLKAEADWAGASVVVTCELDEED